MNLTGHFQHGEILLGFSGSCAIWRDAGRDCPFGASHEGKCWFLYNIQNSPATCLAQACIPAVYKESPVHSPHNHLPELLAATFYRDCSQSALSNWNSKMGEVFLVDSSRLHHSIAPHLYFFEGKKLFHYVDHSFSLSVEKSIIPRYFWCSGGGLRALSSDK